MMRLKGQGGSLPRHAKLIVLSRNSRGAELTRLPRWGNRKLAQTGTGQVRLLVSCGRYGSGAVLGSAVVLVHRFPMPLGYGLLVEVVVVMVLGMAAQMGLCMLLGCIRGSAEVSVPGTIVAMLGMALPFAGPSNMRIEIISGAMAGSFMYDLRELLTRQWIVSYRSSNSGCDFRRIEALTKTDVRLHCPPGYQPAR